MKKFEQGKEYLCGIGNHRDKKITHHKVGTYFDSQFSFSNGAYSPTQLSYKKPLCSNAIVVLSAKKIIPELLKDK